MITLNDHQYKLCLVDTNVVSEMVKRPYDLPGRFYEAFPPSTFIPCFSLFTILELRRNPGVYEGFLRIFSLLPCFVVNPLDQLFRDELLAYPKPEKVSPVTIVAPGAPAAGELYLRDALDQAFSVTETLRSEAQWNASKASILEGILSLVGNYPPKKDKYTPEETKFFVDIVAFTQIALRAREFAERESESRREVNIRAFPSIQMLAYTVFYKFYTDRRQPTDSDVFDLIISSVTPYMDAVVTEGHQAELVRKVSRLASFVQHVSVMSLRELSARPFNA